MMNRAASASTTEHGFPQHQQQQQTAAAAAFGLMGWDNANEGGPATQLTPPAVSTAAAAPSPSNTGTKNASDPSRQYHPEWGVMRDQDFHPLTLKHQRDLENLYQTGSCIADFYFWQANLGGYCMADMVQNIVVSSEGVFILVRRIVEGAAHPGRRKRRQQQQQPRES